MELTAAQRARAAASREAAIARRAAVARCRSRPLDGEAAWQSLSDDCLCKVLRLAGFEVQLAEASQGLRLRMRPLFVFEFGGEMEAAASYLEGVTELAATRAEGLVEHAARQHDLQKAAQREACFERNWAKEQGLLEAVAARIDSDTCFACGELGHWAASCPCRLPKLARAQRVNPYQLVSRRDPATWYGMEKFLFG